MLPLSIRDHEAVPVRALPILTNGQLSADTVAEVLAGSLLPDWCFLPSYELLNDGDLYKMSSEDWDVHLAKLEGLKEHIDKKEKYPNELFDTWRDNHLRRCLLQRSSGWVIGCR